MARVKITRRQAQSVYQKRSKGDWREPIRGERTADGGIFGIKQVWVKRATERLKKKNDKRSMDDLAPFEISDLVDETQEEFACDPKNWGTLFAPGGSQPKDPSFAKGRQLYLAHVAAQDAAAALQPVRVLNSRWAPGAADVHGKQADVEGKENERIGSLPRIKEVRMPEEECQPVVKQEPDDEATRNIFEEPAFRYDGLFGANTSEMPVQKKSRLGDHSFSFGSTTLGSASFRNSSFGSVSSRTAFFGSTSFGSMPFGSASFGRTSFGSTTSNDAQKSAAGPQFQFGLINSVQAPSNHQQAGAGPTATTARPAKPAKYTIQYPSGSLFAAHTGGMKSAPSTIQQPSGSLLGVSAASGSSAATNIHQPSRESFTVTTEGGGSTAPTVQLQPEILSHTTVFSIPAHFKPYQNLCRTYQLNFAMEMQQLDWTKEDEAVTAQKLSRGDIVHISDHITPQSLLPQTQRVHSLDYFNLFLNKILPDCRKPDDWPLSLKQGEPLIQVVRRNRSHMKLTFNFIKMHIDYTIPKFASADPQAVSAKFEVRDDLPGKRKADVPAWFSEVKVKFIRPDLLALEIGAEHVAGDSKDTIKLFIRSC